MRMSSADKPASPPGGGGHPGSPGSAYYNVGEEDVMPVCVRGVEYRVNLHRVRHFPGTRLHDLAQVWAVRCTREGDRRPVYVDRNPIIFHCVLDYYVTGELHLPDALCSGQVKGELEYWGIGADTIAPCCLWKTRNVWDTTAKLAEIMAIYETNIDRRNDARSWRERAWVVYSQPFDTKRGLVLYLFLCTIYISFLMSLVLQSMTNFRVETGRNATNVSGTEEGTLVDFYANTDLLPWLKSLDFILLLLLTSYVFFWFLVCPNKNIYFSLVGAISVTGLLAQWLPVSIVTFYTRQPDWFTRNRYLQGLKVLRIFPVFALLSPLKSMRILVRALMESKTELGLLLVLIAMSSALFGYLVFVFEVGQVHTHFRSIPDGFWWGLVTLTTVGYGDMFPQTPAGRMVGVACAVVGILVVALPVPIISGNFTKIYDLVGVAEYHRMLKTGNDNKKSGEMKSLTSSDPLD